MIRRFHIRSNITEFKLPNKNLTTLRKQRKDINYRHDIQDILRQIEEQGIYSIYVYSKINIYIYFHMYVLIIIIT